ncbi:MAG: DnaD domain protein [Ignavibacteriales bacterium]
MEFEPALEIQRWGYVQTPFILYNYASEFDLDAEDLGILGALFYAYNSVCKPLYKTGVEVGQIMQACPVVSKSRLARRLAKWEKAGLIEIEGSSHIEFTSRKVCLEPMYRKLREIVIRDHPDFKDRQSAKKQQASLFDYEKRIEELEWALDQEKKKILPTQQTSSKEFKKIADFIAKKTGNLTSFKMDSELRKWMSDLGFKTEFILCMLELCFERNITNPREITRIASGLKECSISNLEAMETYFRTFVDNRTWPKNTGFDPELTDFGSFIGVDMNAEARKRVYYRWRYDWGFTPDMIKKAGEIMCSRTKSGGLEYMEAILTSWKEKNLKSVSEVEGELAERKTRRKVESKPLNLLKKTAEDEREIYLPPALASEAGGKG